MAMETFSEHLSITSPPKADESAGVLMEGEEGHLTVDDALAIAQLLEDSSPKQSVADGWEERARDVQPGRGYEVADVGRTSHFLGDVATTGFDRDRFSTPYGMPTVRTRRALSKLFIPRVNM